MSDGFDDLLSQYAGPRVPGQPRLPVHVDVRTGTLTLCGIERRVASDAGNRSILEAFVELVTEVRSERPASLAQLRRMDVAELGRVLDLADRELEHDLTSILGVSDERAHGVVDRLQRADRARRVQRLHVGPAATPKP